MAEKKRGFFSSIGLWFKEAKSDMKKIVWPTPKQVVKNSGIVIISLVISAAVISGLDSLFLLLLTLVIGK